MTRNFLVSVIIASVAIGPGPKGASATEIPDGQSYTNSLGMTFVRIEAGRFEMGFKGKPLREELLTKKGTFVDGDFDERPRHRVTISKRFYMGVCEVTNAQYEQFDPGHGRQRGRGGVSIGDDEAVVVVSWNEAVAFCKWLSEKEGLPYRLPTEAEWEYACRAGTKTAFNTGEVLSAGIAKGPGSRLTVGVTEANAWGLFDMHGNVEEWCQDWYGPYESGDQVDPVGRADGHFKVTRGGSHSTEDYYLRSCNRLGSMAEDKQWMIGFRVVAGEMLETEPLPAVEPPACQQNVRQTVAAAVGPAPRAPGGDPDKPYFRGPRQVVKIADGARGPLFAQHNHFMAVTDCPNGDLMAAWFSCNEEMGRELSIAASRLRYGSDEWDEASLFWDCPDRNDHTQILWHDGEGTIYHMNGLGLKFRRLAVLQRKSRDNGATWSKARLILPHHDVGTGKVVESLFRAADGKLILPMDGRGSLIQISEDDGQTWYDSGGNIRGTHAGVTQLSDGRLMAFGRHGAIDGKMPISESSDMGKTWSYRASPFPSIHTGRRVGVLMLKEGPGPRGALFMAAFCTNMMITDVTGNERPITGLYAAISTDDGKTWPWRRLISDDGPGRYVGTMDGDPILMSASQSEPVGYLTVCQSADGIVHLLSSWNHYAFNLKWLMTAPPAAPPPPPPPASRELPVKRSLPNVYRPLGPGAKGLPSQDEWKWNYNGRGFESDVVSVTGEGLLRMKTNEQQQFWLRTEEADVFGAVDPKKGFAAEIKTQVIGRTAEQRGVDLELYDGAGSRYAVTITDTGVYWYEGVVQSSSFLPFKQYVALAEGLDNTDGIHTYRVAVREDRVAQVYRDGELLGTEPLIYRTPRYPYIYFGMGQGAEGLVEYVSYDLSGPSRP